MQCISQFRLSHPSRVDIFVSLQKMSTAAQCLKMPFLKEFQSIVQGAKLPQITYSAPNLIR